MQIMDMIQTINFDFETGICTAGFINDEQVSFSFDKFALFGTSEGFLDCLGHFSFLEAIGKCAQTMSENEDKMKK